MLRAGADRRNLELPHHQVRAETPRIMAVRRVAPPELQPKDFPFTAENDAWAKKQIEKYP